MKSPQRISIVGKFVADGKTKLFESGSLFRKLLEQEIGTCPEVKMIYDRRPFKHGHQKGKPEVTIVTHVYTTAPLSFDDIPRQYVGEGPATEPVPEYVQDYKDLVAIRNLVWDAVKKILSQNSSFKFDFLK